MSAAATPKGPFKGKGRELGQLKLKEDSTMDLPETISLVGPDGTHWSLETLPTARKDAIRMVRSAWIGPGRYAFVRRISDPDCGEIDLTEIIVSAYTNGELGITGLTAFSTLKATSHDISLYIRGITGLDGNTPVRLLLDVYEDAPDHERNIAWLSVENLSGNIVAEFALEVHDRLTLPEKPESPTGTIFACELPSFRSAIRFVSIACESFHCENVRIRTFPLNAQSADWFS